MKDMQKGFYQMNKVELKFNIKEMQTSKPTSLQAAVNLIKFHLDASVRGLERYITKKGYSFTELDKTSVVEIKLEGSSIQLCIREQEESDIHIYREGLQAFDVTDQEKPIS